jgi:hypothetical protein
MICVSAVGRTAFDGFPVCYSRGATFNLLSSKEKEQNEKSYEQKNPDVEASGPVARGFVINLRRYF